MWQVVLGEKAVVVEPGAVPHGLAARGERRQMNIFSQAAVDFGRFNSHPDAQRDGAVRQCLGDAVSCGNRDIKEGEGDRGIGLLSEGQPGNLALQDALTIGCDPHNAHMADVPRIKRRAGYPVPG